MEILKKESTTLVLASKDELAKNCLDALSNLPDRESSIIIAKDLKRKEKYEPAKALQAYLVNNNSYKKIQVRNYPDVFCCDLASLSTLKKYRGASLCEMFLVSKMGSLSDKFKVGKCMEKDDLETLAELILEDFFYLNVADIKLFSKNALRGVYGKTFDRLDVPTILEWLNKYVDARFKAAAKESKKLKQIQESETAIPMPDFLKDMIKIEPTNAPILNYNEKGFKEFCKIFKDHLQEEYKRFCEGMSVKEMPSIQEFSLHQFLNLSKQIRKNR